MKQNHLHAVSFILAILGATPASAAPEIPSSPLADVDHASVGPANAAVRAAEAAVVEMTLAQPPCLACAQRAEQLSQEALRLNISATLPHIYLALAYGYRARIVGLVAAEREGLARKARDEIGLALKANPNDPLALATLGGWNFDVVRTGGAFLGRLTYGATVDQGLALFSKALRLEPGNVVVRYQFALELASCDFATYRNMVAQQLERVSANEPRSPYEGKLRARAIELLTSLRAGDEAAFSRGVRGALGIPEPK